MLYRYKLSRFQLIPFYDLKWKIINKPTVTNSDCLIDFLQDWKWLVISAALPYKVLFI